MESKSWIHPTFYLEIYLIRLEWESGPLRGIIVCVLMNKAFGCVGGACLNTSPISVPSKLN